jgi:TIR domain
MGQKFFISFNSADKTKAHWIAWTLKEAGHEVAVHDREIPAGGNAPLWMNTKLAWADRLIAVISPDYLPTRYSPMEWASQIWNDPDGTKGSVIPVIVKPTLGLPPLLNGLSCSEAEAKRRLFKGVDMPAPPQRPLRSWRSSSVMAVARPKGNARQTSEAWLCAEITGTNAFSGETNTSIGWRFLTGFGAMQKRFHGGIRDKLDCLWSEEPCSH